LALLVSTSVPNNSVDASTDLASPITVTEMISSYLDRPILPLAVTLPMLLQNVEGELANEKLDLEEKQRLHQRCDLIRRLLASGQIT